MMRKRGFATGQVFCDAKGVNGTGRRLGEEGIGIIVNE